MKLKYRMLPLSLLVIMLAMGGAVAHAQGGATSTLAGTVTDSTGAMVPGADIVAKHNATGATFTAVSGAAGSFTIPAMPPGTYTVTVALQGFKTVSLNDVILNVGVTSSVKAVLQLGEIAETVTVQGASEVIQTQTTAVAATLTTRQIVNLPLVGRGAFELISYTPGVVTTTGSVRDGTVNGLPQSTVNITLDGMNIQDNYAKTWDGMFTRVSPRIDAVEEVTISTAASGADMAGQGAAQVRFVTRSGTNRYQGSAYYYMRRDWLNTNTWFNLHRNVDPVTGAPQGRPTLFQDQPGVRFGGPIIKDKAFFFVNYEWVSSPGMYTANRTIMSPRSEQGLFQYSGGTVDLMALARKNGQVATFDPVVAKLLADVRASTSQGTVTTTIDPLTQTFAWQQPTKGTTKYPTVKLDYQVTSNHRVSFSVTQNHLISDPDTTNNRQMVYPGFPFHGLQDSVRYVWQGSVRSILRGNLVNEARFGGTGGATKFSPDINAGMFGGTSVGDMGGYGLSWSAFKSINNAYTTANYSSREGSTKLIEDTLSWMKGNHSVNFGGSVTRGDVWLLNQQIVPTATLGMATGDPALGMFTTANFPGASGTDLTNARNLYAVLTGRVTAIGREARVGDDGKTYTLLGPSNQLGRIWQLGFFVQDGWRLRPDLTINAGLRYEVQMPFYALNDSYSMATVADLFGTTGPGADLVVGSTVTNLGNLFKYGAQEGSASTYKLLEKGSQTYETDWNNFAPSIGAAWTTGAEEGWLRKVFGTRGKTVIRGGLNIAYQRGGMSDFTETFGANPGIQIDATRNLTNKNLGTLPVLFSSSDLSAPDIPLTRVYPMAVPSASSNIRIFDPNVKLPWALTATAGIQRELTTNTAVEVRFIHTDSHGSWTLQNLAGQLNYNEISVVNNGFMDEFRVAQANLAANVAAEKGSTFAYTGAPGTNPLPIFLGALNGLGGANVNDPKKYTGNGWTDSALVQSLYAYNPSLCCSTTTSAAGILRNSATYRGNLTKAGYPVNFWVVNPDVTAASVVANGPSTRYNGIQLSLNRRFSGGVQVQAYYTYGKGYQQDFYSFSKPWKETEQTYTNASASAGNVRHTFNLNWVYELPFGQGKRFGGDAGPALNRVIGDWSFMGVARFASGRPADFGNVRLIGFTQKDLQNMMKLRMTTDPNNQFRTLVWYLPQDIIDNTVKAFSVTATGYSEDAPTGRYFAPASSPACLESVAAYGDCGQRSVIVTGPAYIRWDMTLGKLIPIKGRVRLEFQFQMFNVFNRVNFNLPGAFGDPLYTGSVADSYQVTGATDQSRTMQIAFRVNF